MGEQNLDFLGGGSSGLTEELLKKIQRTIIQATFTSRHSEARKERKSHRHYTLKARNHKRERRRTANASRARNR